MDKIAVLIPCYNESKTIEKVVKDFKAVLPEATIYVYDNNSSMAQMKLPVPQVLKFVMNTSRVRGMLSKHVP